MSERKFTYLLYLLLRRYRRCLYILEYVLPNPPFGYCFLMFKYISNKLPNGKPCRTSQIVYRVDVSKNKDNETKFYYGLTETSFKKRYGDHKRAFIHEQHKNDTELSKYIWDLTSAHKVPTIKWCIVRKIRGNAKSDFCKLCLTEKYFILNNLGDNKLYNKKSEFVNKCRHQKKLLLSSVRCEDSMD